MKSAANSQIFEQASDELAVLVRGYMLPSIENPLLGLHFTRCESRIVQILMVNFGKDVSEAALMDALYYDHPGDEPLAGTLKVLVHRIRAKLKKANSDYRLETCWSVGYRMEAK